MTGPLRGDRRGEVKDRAIKEKITFFTFFQLSNIPTAIKLAGGLVLMARPLREELFFAASLNHQTKINLLR